MANWEKKYPQIAKKYKDIRVSGYILDPGQRQRATGRAAILAHLERLKKLDSVKRRKK
jgi:hypothetical protein